MTPLRQPLRSNRPNAALELRREDLLATVSQSLIHALNSELEARYPEEGANFFRLEPEEVAEGRGGFFVAYFDDQPVGCGAVRLIEPGIAEIKRMYVAPSVRGQGIGRRIVAVLEAEAIRLHAHHILLETGPRQPDALAMYQRAGFAEIPLYGEYIGSNFSVCMAKNIEPPR